MIHATRPFVVNDWIQTKIEGYEVSGFVEVCLLIYLKCVDSQQSLTLDFVLLSYRYVCVLLWVLAHMSCFCWRNIFPYYFNHLSLSWHCFNQQHVGWWSPTIIRGEDREAVHIPNHKFTVNVVRNLSQKTHWRIKTHLAVSHLDVGKINVSNFDCTHILRFAWHPPPKKTSMLYDIIPDTDMCLLYS